MAALAVAAFGLTGGRDEHERGPGGSATLLEDDPEPRALVGGEGPQELEDDGALGDVRPDDLSQALQLHSGAVEFHVEAQHGGEARSHAELEFVASGQLGEDELLLAVYAGHGELLGLGGGAPGEQRPHGGQPERGGGHGGAFLVPGVGPQEGGIARSPGVGQAHPA
jgi:hypothetical protein